jgi:hypothetical protein
VDDLLKLGLLNQLDDDLLVDLCGDAPSKGRSIDNVTNVIKIIDHSVRQVIETFKKVPPFADLEEHDQIQLIKGLYTRVNCSIVYI